MPTFAITHILNMLAIRPIFSWIVVALLAACATPEHDTLREIQQPAEIRMLPMELAYSFPGFLGKPATVAVVSGQYRLHLENDAGWFYTGVQPSVLTTAPDGISLAWGGVWIPKDRSKKARIHYFNLQKGYGGATVEQALQKWAHESAAMDPKVGERIANQVGLQFGIVAFLLTMDVGNPPLIYPASDSEAFTQLVREHFLGVPESTERPTLQASEPKPTDSVRR